MVIIIFCVDLRGSIVFILITSDKIIWKKFSVRDKLTNYHIMLIIICYVYIHALNMNTFELLQ